MTVRALVVGLGSIGQRHARNLRTILGEDLLLATYRTRRNGLVVTEKLVLGSGDPEADFNGGVFSDLDRALEARPDLVLVCNPTSLHVAVARAAVEAGAAVFIEKPLSSDLTGLDELLAVATARDAVVMVGCQLRFHPALLRLRALLQERVLGRLLAVHVEQAEYLPSFHTYEDYRSSYVARRDLGGGVVLTQIHELDYIQWLFGAPSRLFAVGGRLGSLEIDVEDTASALFENEVDGGPLAVHVHLDYLQRPPRRTCRVVGEAGTIDLDLRAPSLRWVNADGQLVVEDRFPDFDRAEIFRDELRHFLASARREKPVTVDLPFAIETTRIALAMRAALETGELQRLS